MSIDLTDPIFNDEAAAWEHFESIRWANGPECPHCGVVNEADKIIGKTARHGLYRCRACVKQFTATIGTVYEKSHIPMHKWLLATHLMCASKKGISAHQLFRTLGFGSYRTAWFMAHRIREAMRGGDLAPMGGAGGVVEIDETFIGQKPDTFRSCGFAHKHAILSLVERGGSVRSFHVDDTTAAHLVPILRANIAKEASVMTDEAGQYTHLSKDFASHETVNHGAGEYGRGEVHTNTVEGFYSIFKRGMKGVYRHCGEKHLHRYVVAEFDFRYNNRVALGVGDEERATKAIAGVAGKRLTYQQPQTPRA